ncbi:hypothetical protein EV356DRAFT_490707 [Viridothelium virens]|uniref:Uncharacterized protein n=1 Tax=Viridothelium virens TaxID=1048519 RepID=A0A6A6H013_VIRVR|nr:hypothetical protein EV356DRAFT_490707 [Viridothelium virens]
MAAPRGIQKLSNELLREILDHIEADPEKLVSLDRRAYLSQESFRPPPPPQPDQAQDVGHFRLTCKRFSELGAVHQFARVTTRFSRKGLRRLDNIASQPHLARHVKKFSYMVPYFYVEGRERVRELLPSLPHSLGFLDVGHFTQKVSDQKEIIASELDAQVLNKAIHAFTSLQHVQILRVQDEEDSVLLSYIRQHADVTHLVELKWAPACSHSTRTIGAALLATKSPCSRFSSPMLSPQSAVVLAEQRPRSFSTLAAQFTCLELHFDDSSTDLDSKMRELSELFKTVFQTAKNMQAVHVGFPSHRPLSLGLEEVFHHVHWRNLLAFGIQGWRLHSHEIIGFAQRHWDKLKGLRLRDVLLKEGSNWKDVLSFLRDGMPRLDWVSLRRIGYAKHFDEMYAASGAEVPDDPPGVASESDDEGGWDAQADAEGNVDGDSEADDHGAPGPANGDSEEERESDDEHGPAANEMDFPVMSPDTPSSVPWCNCNGQSYPESAEDLGDNGISVTNMQRKAWEKWVVRRCPEHSGK